MAKQLTRSSKHDAIALLRDDHKKVQKLFKEYQGAKDDAKKKAVVDEVCTDLTVRSQLEEELFISRGARGDRCMDIMDQAEVEHTLAKHLVEELKAMQPDDPLYGAKFTVLGEYVAHHIEEEQKEMFPKVKKAKMDLDSLGEQMAARKGELLAARRASNNEKVDEVRRRWHDGSVAYACFASLIEEKPMTTMIFMGIGAALMYFFDPDSGRPRRERLCNRILHAPLTKGESR